MIQIRKQKAMIRPIVRLVTLAVVLVLLATALGCGRNLAKIPDKLVVLTFDDAVKSQATYAAPLLKQHGFGATFFVTEAWKHRKDFKEENYMTLDEIKKLAEDGFEIGNHTRSHKSAPGLSKGQFRAELEYIENRCREYGIARPTTFCYCGYAFSRAAVEVLAERGYTFARRGSRPELPYVETGQVGLAYNPSEEHPLLIPTAATAGPTCGYGDLVTAAKMARDGKIAVFAFHGVPDLDHPWVHTDPAVFADFIKYLHKNKYTVIALRDLARYVDAAKGPSDPFAPIARRMGVRTEQVKGN